MQNISNSSGFLLVQLGQEPRARGEKDFSDRLSSLPGGMSDARVGLFRRHPCFLFSVNDSVGRRKGVALYDVSSPLGARGQSNI